MKFSIINMILRFNFIGNKKLIILIKLEIKNLECNFYKDV
jgi:hypothetical protein